MKVWQPGSHLTMQRGGEVSDWSWRQTARRMSVLARLTAPYKARTALALASLLAATVPWEVSARVRQASDGGLDAEARGEPAGAAAASSTGK